MTATAEDVVPLRRVRDRLRRAFEADDVGAVAALNGLLRSVGAVPQLERANGGWAFNYGPRRPSLPAALAGRVAVALLEVARAGDDLVARSGQQSVVFGAGDARVCVSTPLRQEAKASRYLRRHPAGVMSLSFRVKDLDATMAFLDKRGGTFLADPIEDVDASGRWRAVEIATGRRVTAHDGRVVALEAETLCLHGDNPQALENARAVRRALLDQGIEIKGISA